MNDYLCDLRSQTLTPRYGKIIGGVLIIALLCKLINWFAVFYAGGDIWSGYSIADYLINWQSGFVRRGLYGEILYQYSLLTGLSPLTILVPIFVGAYAGITIWLLRLCKKRDVEWWIVLSAVLCGFVDYIERKDFLLYLLLFSAFTIVNRVGPSIKRNVGITLLLILGLLIHEAFFFWGLPIMFFLMWGERRLRGLNIGIGIGLTAIFLTLCLFKGDVSNAITIYDSWKDLLPLPADWRDCGALEALSWKLPDTIVYHFTSNLHTEPYNWLTIFYRFAAFAIFYILITNYFFFFSHRSVPDCRERRNVMSGWLILIAVFMLPYWLFLSNDWGRLYQALAMTICGIWLIMPFERLRKSLPGIVLKTAEALNGKLYRIIIPTRGLLLLMLLFLGISPYNFQPVAAFAESPAGAIITTLLDAAHLLRLSL